MDPGRVAAAAVVAFIGLAFLIGFFRAFRERIYLALLGFSFFALAGRILIRGPQLNFLKYALLALAGILFLAAVFFAVKQTLAQMRLIQEHRAGLEREMQEYLEQLKQRAADQGKQAPGESPAPEQPQTSDSEAKDREASDSGAAQ